MREEVMLGANSHIKAYYKIQYRYKSIRPFKDELTF